MGSGSSSKAAGRAFRGRARRRAASLCACRKAIVVEKIGGPEVLALADRDPGAPGPGQVRVRVAAAGVNFIDVYFRTGLYPRPLPFVAGLEGAGRIEAVGPDVAGLAVGDLVAWASAPGSYAEAVVAPASFGRARAGRRCRTRSPPPPCSRA